MKKLLMITAAVLIAQATPVFAETGDHDGKPGGKMFEKQDTNGDGVISEAEFLETAKKRFAEMDSDGNGSVTKEEGKAAHEAKRAKMKEKREKWKEKRQERKEARKDKRSEGAED